MNTARLEHQLAQADLTLPSQIQKRSGTTVPFDVNRIERAVTACFANEGLTPLFPATEVTKRVAQAVASKYGGATPTVEQVQDAVELTLLTLGEYEAAKAYIRYRDQRSQEREGRTVPDEIRAIFEEDKQYFATSAQQFMFYDKYSRFNWELQRRETWHETVNRTVDHLKWEVRMHVYLEKHPDAIDFEVAAWPAGQLEALVPDSSLPITKREFDRLHKGILEMKVAPSMRLLAMAGDAARRNSMALYNCSYLPVKDIQAFVEAMLISMAGCGVGFSVERDYIEQFPRVKRQTGVKLPTHVIVDTTEGWAEALRVGMETWWDGMDIDFDSTYVRPAGAILKTKGGRASGPEPLTTMLTTIRSVIIARQGSHIKTTDGHLMMCAVGEAAVQGGVRRTAMISLFDWDDHEMRNIKSGPNMNPLLFNANNSAVWPENVSNLDIAQQMLDMIRTKSGEPGIFSRENANRTKPERREAARFGTNPCGEILLREFGFCNLSQAIARPGDTVESLREKVELATLAGILQSLSTRFPGLRPEWKQNCIDERLLGVDLTAQADCELLQENTQEGAELRRSLLEYSLEVATRLAARLGIAVPAAISCNKPAGNSAEAFDASNGIHRRKARRFKRRYTVGSSGPMFRVLRDAGAPMEPRHGSTEATATQWILTIPKKSPDNAPLISDATAVDQCDFWLLNKQNWTEHNPSCTITYREDEIIDLIKWVCDHKNEIGGLSFFPSADAIYKQAPFEEITDEEYERLNAEFPEIDYSLIYSYELQDMTTAAQELACFAGSCAVE